jgi:hypothetical protein
MKKDELKKLIKPLIKECLKEVLIEEGFTKMLSESVQIQQSAEQPKVLQQLKSDSAQQSKQTLAEAKKKMLDEIGMGGFDAFAGTNPLKEGGNARIPEVAVTGFNSGDPGVDISRLMSGKMKATFNALNGKKVKE